MCVEISSAAMSQRARLTWYKLLLRTPAAKGSNGIFLFLSFFFHAYTGNRSGYLCPVSADIFWEGQEIKQPLVTARRSLSSYK